MIAETAMPWIKPRYLWEDTDRHGKVRLYVKRPGRPKVRIREEAGTEAFWSAYAKAIEGDVAEPVQAGLSAASPPAPGTFGWLIGQWKESHEFRALGAETRRMRQNLLDACCLEPIAPKSPLLFSAIPLAKITQAHVRMLRDRKRDLPEGANNRLKALRVLFGWLLGQDEICRRYGFGINPARDVPKFKTPNPDGFHTWTVEEVEQYERRHKRGSMARLALALFLFTGQRRSDVIRFGRQHLRRRAGADDDKSWLVFTQHKNRARKPVTLELPVLDILKSAIDEGPCGHLTFLVTERGKPFSPAGFGNRMRKWCDQAGLPQCSAHGLRKAGACIAAENGATDAQMMAIFGWSDPRMAAKYRRRASQKKIAGEHMHLVLANRKTASADVALPLFDWDQGASPAADELGTEAGRNTPTRKGVA